MIEEAILNAFLSIDIGTCDSSKENYENVFELDVQIFDTKLKRRIAERINEETAGEKAYPVLDVELSEKMATASKLLQDEYLTIISTTPMPIKRAKILYDRYKKQKEMEKLR